jgi:hypothetical protein
MGIEVIIFFGEQGKEDVCATEGGGVVPVGVEADGREHGYSWIGYVKEYAEDRWCVEFLEAAAECGDARTARRKAGQVRAVRARLGREGRWRNTSSRRSSSRLHMVVGAAGEDFFFFFGGGGGGCGICREAMSPHWR